MSPPVTRMLKSLRGIASRLEDASVQPELYVELIAAAAAIDIRRVIAELEAYDVSDEQVMTNAFGAAEHGDECPLCRNGTVEVTSDHASCRGECGFTLTYGARP